MRKQYTVHYNESGEIACEGTFYSKPEAFDALQEFITDINAGVDEKNEDYLTPFDFHLESVDEREPEDYINDFKDAQEYLGLSYEQICDEYRLRLCNQFYIDWNDTYWIAGRVGGVLDIQSYYAIDMDELRYIVDNSMTFEDFEEWYDQWMYTDNKNGINIRSWLMGARPELFNNKP